MSAKHTADCEEWCNHCEVCGAGISYGSRCHDHPLRCDAEIADFSCACRLGVGHLTPEHACKCGHTWAVNA